MKINEMRSIIHKPPKSISTSRFHCAYKGTGRSAPESIRPGSIRPTSAPSAVVPPQVYGRSAPGPGSFRTNCSVAFKRGLAGVKA